MTIKEMKKEVNNIKSWLKDNVTSKEWGLVLNLQAKYINERGYKREYIASNANKAEILNYLECLIEACYDELGTEKFTYLYD